VHVQIHIEIHTHEPYFFVHNTQSIIMTASGLLQFQFISKHYFLIISLLVVYLFGLQSVNAIEYCQFEGASNPADGFPLPIPLPRDGSSNSASIASGSSTIASLGYYECPPGTHCCPRKLCCSDNDQLNLSDRPKYRFFDIDERYVTTIMANCKTSCIIKCV